MPMWKAVSLLSEEFRDRFTINRTIREGVQLLEMNMQTTAGCGRIVKRKLVDGSRTFSFSIVRNRRLNGRPGHVQLAKVATINESEFDARAEQFWNNVDSILADLVKTNQIWVNDAEKVRKQFSKIIPRPASTVIEIEEKPQSNYELLNSLIMQVGEKATIKLRERGRDL